MGDIEKPRIVYRRRARSSAATANDAPARLCLFGPDSQLLAEMIVGRGSTAEWWPAGDPGLSPAAPGSTLHIEGAPVYLFVRASVAR